jgi:hypothetical protein
MAMRRLLISRAECRATSTQAHTILLSAQFYEVAM